jgi:hypothetical protein
MRTSKKRKPLPVLDVHEVEALLPLALAIEESQAGIHRAIIDLYQRVGKAIAEATAGMSPPQEREYLRRFASYYSDNMGLCVSEDQIRRWLRVYRGLTHEQLQAAQHAGLTPQQVLCLATTWVGSRNRDEWIARIGEERRMKLSGWRARWGFANRSAEDNATASVDTAARNGTPEAQNSD